MDIIRLSLSLVDSCLQFLRVRSGGENDIDKTRFFNNVTSRTVNASYYFISEDLVRRFKQCSPKILVTTAGQTKRVKALVNKTVNTVIIYI